MGGWRYIPLTLLGLLTLLAGGAAVAGQLSNPKNAVTTVKNATAATYGEPLGSTSFTMDLASSVSSSGTHGFITQTRRVVYAPTNDMVVYQTKPSFRRIGRPSTKEIEKAVTEYGAVTAGDTAWVSAGNALTRTEPFTVFSARVTPGEQVANGTVHETVMIRGGYLVFIKLHVVVPRQIFGNGGVSPGGVVNETYRVLRINGKAAPTVAS